MTKKKVNGETRKNYVIITSVFVLYCGAFRYFVQYKENRKYFRWPYEISPKYQKRFRCFLIFGHFFLYLIIKRIYKNEYFLLLQCCVTYANSVFKTILLCSALTLWKLSLHFQNNDDTRYNEIHSKWKIIKLFVCP